ncbi:MAG: hypothetical protein AB7E49_11490 [Campylobacterales bacterium]
MNRQQTIKVEGKNYEITLHEKSGDLITKALDELRKRGENISAKQLLEAYLTKAVACETLKEEIARIEASLGELG